jgi:DNA-binding transcriptional regulator YdaS (Cro superfamily)
MDTGDSGIRQAIEAAGTVAALARKLGVTRSAIHQWVRIPAERVLDIERATGVSRQTLRPDLYPPEPARAS